MSYLFNQGYNSQISSMIINQKIDYLYGNNGVLKGFEISNNGLNIIVKNETTSDKIGLALIYGTIVAYYLVGNESYANITLPGDDGKYYIYGEYQHELKTFKLYHTTILENALGKWKIFLGHAIVTNGIITELKGLSDPTIEETDIKYRRIPTLSDAFAYLYNTTIAITGDVEDIIKNYIENIQIEIDKMKQEIAKIKQEIIDEIDLDNLAKRSKMNSFSFNCFQVKTFDNNIDKTGRLLISLPVTILSGEVLSVSIQGIEKSTGKTFSLLLGGILDSSDKVWKCTSAYVQGECNFEFVTFGRSSNPDIGIYISLGDNSTTWDHVSLSIKQIIVSNIPPTNLNDSVRKLWRDNWRINIYDYAIIPDTTFSLSTKVKTGGPQDGEYVVPGRKVVAGTGLTGGGSLTSDVTLSVNFGNTANSVARGNHNHDGVYAPLYNKEEGSSNKIAIYNNEGKLTTYETFPYQKLDYLKNLNQDIMELLSGKPGEEHKHSNISIGAGTGLLGGGNLGGNISLSVDFGSGYYSVARGSHNHDGSYEPVINMIGGANKVAIYNSNNKLSYYPDFDASKLGYLKNLNKDIMELINNVSISDHNHDSKYLKLTGGTVDGNLNVTGVTQLTEVTIQNRKIVFGSSTPSNKVDKMIWFKCR